MMWFLVFLGYSDSDSDQQMQEARFDAINCRYLKSIQLSGIIPEHIVMNQLLVCD